MRLINKILLLVCSLTLLLCTTLVSAETYYSEYADTNQANTLKGIFDSNNPYFATIVTETPTGSAYIGLDENYQTIGISSLNKTSTIKSDFEVFSLTNSIIIGIFILISIPILLLLFVMCSALVQSMIYTITGYTFLGQGSYNANQ